MTPDEALDLLDRCYHSPAVPIVRAEVERLRQERDAAMAGVNEHYAEVERLRHDIARHVHIAAEQAQEMEELRADLTAARALLQKHGIDYDAA